MDERTVTSWSDLMDALEMFFEGSWIFRGVSKSEYKLIPSIGRSDARRTKDGRYVGIDKYNRDEEIEIFERFRLQSIPFLAYHPATKLELMALAQHHGLPTRLLD